MMMMLMDTEQCIEIEIIPSVSVTDPWVSVCMHVQDQNLY